MASTSRPQQANTVGDHVYVIQVQNFHLTLGIVGIRFRPRPHHHTKLLMLYGTANIYRPLNASFTEVDITVWKRPDLRDPVAGFHSLPQLRHFF